MHDLWVHIYSQVHRPWTSGDLVPLPWPTAVIQYETHRLSTAKLWCWMFDIRDKTYEMYAKYFTLPVCFSCSQVIKWQHDFFEACTSRVLETIALVQPVPYSHVLTLDSTIRDFPLPPELDMFGPDGSSTETTLLMQQALASSRRQIGLSEYRPWFFVANSITIVLLQLHRNYFTQCLNGPEPFSLSHPYAPSVAATYASACCLISGFELVMKHQPLHCKRVFGYWFNVFSAVVCSRYLLRRGRVLTISLGGYLLFRSEGASRFSSCIGSFGDAKNTIDICWNIKGQLQSC